MGWKFENFEKNIFWFFNFVDRFYIITYGPDMFIARGPGPGSRSTYFILAPKVETILHKNPLTVYRLKWSPKNCISHIPSITKIGASMRDPNFWKEQFLRQFAWSKWRFWGRFLSLKAGFRVLEARSSTRKFQNFYFSYFEARTCSNQYRIWEWHPLRLKPTQPLLLDRFLERYFQIQSAAGSTRLTRYRV